MTKNDKKLLEKAENLSSIDWGEASILAGQADSKKVKERINDIGKSLYHREEAMADCM